MPPSPPNRSRWEPLLEAARAATKNAYAPGSQFRVGAALRTTTGEIFSGCNVENASYGLSNCAERTAVFSAVAKLGGEMKIEAIAVVSGTDKPCPPCGACRQVIYEFGKEARVYYQAESGWKEASILELLPDGFQFERKSE